MSGHVVLLTDEGAEALPPHNVDDRHISEATLQELLDDHPSVLPVDEIGDEWGPLISLGREIEVPSGYIDNLFINPDGRITVVETKLWRNPQSRREVVAQLIDYAAELARLDYEAFELAVFGDNDGRLWERVQSEAALPPERESSFVDEVQRSLENGRFLLLIVGDGIRTGLEAMTNILTSQPQLGFHLELISLAFHELPSGDRIVVPTRIGKTETVGRTQIEFVGTKPTEVEVTPVTEDDNAKPDRLRGYGDLEARAEEDMSPQEAKALADYVRRWVAGGGVVSWNQTSVSLRLKTSLTASKRVSLATVWADGGFTLTGQTFADWQHIITPEAARSFADRLGLAEGAGLRFSGRPNYSDPATIENFEAVFDELTAAVRAAEEAAR